MLYLDPGRPGKLELAEKHKSVRLLRAGRFEEELSFSLNRHGMQWSDSFIFQSLLYFDPSRPGKLELAEKHKSVRLLRTGRFEKEQLFHKFVTK